MSESVLRNPEKGRPSLGNKQILSASGLEDYGETLVELGTSK